ncbi:MBL fold metallo-hydrolase [Solirubrobacter phytolaccae]|uniref:MBL fold metallo-hydrolase n=1 Tax=Solirubrobacter phytolaccae TaxID=1404360 RepID=A0A9X3S8C0_9ACTN|nr:MBL fold metallo-hydrolase [Solirubrobacter phytolaccae]MDA0180111.1 MBL fold metallo-hydrolase [Solirubrobacter phytolaccae]
MKTTPVTDHLTQLTRWHFVNAFLVREDDGLTLVDTTIGRRPDALLEAARRAGAPIRRIALTHGHGDHIGLLDALHERLGSEVEVLVPELDERILAGETEGKFPGSWPTVKTRADRRLQPGDRVGSLEVVATPGHTPGHVAFLDTRDRAVIAGDTFTAYGRVMTSDKLRLPFPLAAAATWHGDEVLTSAQTVRALQPSVMVVGHGPVVRDPVARIDRALELAGATVATA